MGGVKLRADPAARVRLPATRPRARRRWPLRRLRGLARWGLRLVVVGALAGSGVVLVRTGIAPKLADGLGGGAVAATGWVGLRLQDVLVEGRTMAPRPQVMAAIDARRGMPILAYDAAAARGRLEAIPWIESAIVERRLPATVYVRLTERRPLALWQRGGKFVVIDAKGAVILDHDIDAFAALPVVIGDDAPAHAENLLLLLATEPDLQKRVAAAIRVGGRRWNLKLDNGIDVRLPEEDAAEAWSRLAALEREQKLLSRDVQAIDLRLPDRLIVRVGNESTPAPTNAKDDRSTKRPAAR